MRNKKEQQLIIGVATSIPKLLLNILLYALVFAMIVKTVQFTYSFCYEIFGDVRAEETPGRTATVQIKTGETTMSIATKLSDYGFVKSKYAFYLKIKVMGYNIMPGTYVINTSMNYNELLDIITDIDNSIAPEVALHPTNTPTPTLTPTNTPIPTMPITRPVMAPSLTIMPND
ncbi:MAG: endolytic transglycosylase MltG [Lachnospiraceae bacterium]|nr:endolytic transglycosylase MltG [Lachnospiraceae bacterium]